MTKPKTKDTNEYGLDLKGQMILEEYRELLPVFSRLKSLVLEKLGECLQRAGLIVSSLDPLPRRKPYPRFGTRSTCQVGEKPHREIGTERL